METAECIEVAVYVITFRTLLNIGNMVVACFTKFASDLFLDDIQRLQFTAKKFLVGCELLPLLYGEHSMQTFLLFVPNALFQASYTLVSREVELAIKVGKLEVGQA